MNWKWFSAKQLREAASFADSGGVAVCESALRGKEKAQLFAPTVPVLQEAAKTLGLQSRWMIKGLRPHFELRGEPLRIAKRQCKEIEELVSVG